MRKYILLLLAFVFFVFSGCQKDDLNEQETIIENRDFYEFMKEWYYWNDKIPEIDPARFENVFEVLEAIRYRPLDRWSFIEDWNTLYAYIVEARIIGYGIGLFWDQQGFLRIGFLHNNTEMYERGVRRGWIIERINGVSVSPGLNITQMLGPDQIGVSNTFHFRTPQNTLVQVEVQKREIIANAILHREIIETGGRRIGYLVLQQFRGLNLENELNQAFSEFAAVGIEELILDMRYNGGGLVIPANRLASLIAGPSFANMPFVKFEYNANKSNEHNETVNLLSLENSLSLNRLIVITTRGTASASELVINGLRPFINVVVVGSTTYGKPMGANIFSYNNKWAFVPITFKGRNANNEGDFFNGIPANIPAPDDLTRNFGDPLEASLHTALEYIRTGVTVGIKVAEPPVRQPWEDMEGIRREARIH
ncbi:MAG TPA: S41 family peptidase [Bacteroidales bacterium]|nr:S41 family peptidase [Bacteroidales bacterium]